jgi:hypothetical protein
MNGSNKCVEAEKPQIDAGFRLISEDSLNNITEMWFFT